MRTPAGMTAAVMAVTVALAGCGTSSLPGDAARIDSDLVAHVGSDDIRQVGESVNTFGFDVLAEVTDGTENVITSPVSVFTLLSMVLAGTGGDTADAVAATLHLDEPHDTRLGALVRTLADTDDVTLSIANAAWVRDGVDLKQDYLDYVTGGLGAVVEEVDFTAPETMEEIDAWVDERTEGRIDEIANDLGLPSDSAMFVLLNAVYFLGEWTTRFDPGHTRPRPFTVASGEQPEVPTMSTRGERFEHVIRDSYRMLRLPYGDDERYGMEVVLPNPDHELADVVDILDATEWQDAVAELTATGFDEVALPRFELEWDLTLNDALITLGMRPAFLMDADFAPMTDADVFIDRVVHKTYIRVDETGTEAAAVTGTAGDGSAPVDPAVFLVDRPFAFTISDRETGVIIFLGVVTDPRS
ncbi:serpin family protein [Phytoactinopolyspora limicola]|uniref:serpin family protein n=1 Tax=Phytoactinopolyspora limicola TaxID=2715536 RepID=UPI00140BE074|nr:serpin family protein [Phytoactinopolyspora limicola]